MVLQDQNIVSFNAAAATYDQDFTFSEIGILQRKRVYYWLEKNGFFDSSLKVFEINCGTGYDTYQFTNKGHSVFATDASKEMIATAKSKYPDLQFLQADFNMALELPELKNADVVFSNFGGLNCISFEELKSFITKMAKNQKKGSQLIFVIMPDKCFMETIYFLLKFKFKNAFRRKNKNPLMVNVNGTGIPTWYHSPAKVKSILSGDYLIKLVKPIAVFLPPSFMEPFFKKRKKILVILNRLERIFGKLSFLSGLADHYIIIAEKR
jgi:ubiquinone/menaquinone biosynthesis C-methylase UbiE